MHILTVVDVLDQFREALHPTLTSVPANNPLEATFVTNCKSEVIHDAVDKGFHGGHTAGGTDCGISFLGQGHRMTHILWKPVRLLDFN